MVAGGFVLHGLFKPLTKVSVELPVLPERGQEMVSLPAPVFGLVGRDSVPARLFWNMPMS
eukprot:11105989-Prorocentrum_lima.AAC.1